MTVIAPSSWSESRIRNPSNPSPSCTSWGICCYIGAARLPQAQYAAYRAWRSTQTISEQKGGSRKYRHREPSHIFGNTFARTVLDALHGQYITLAKASHYLDGLKINDLHQLERYYAGV